MLIILLASVATGCDSAGSKPQAEGGEVYSAGGQSFRVETVAEDLVVPWAIDWLPDGRMLVTTRPGRLWAIRAGGGEKQLLAEIDEVIHQGEHGLMGLAVSPDFADNRHIFLSYTTGGGEERKKNVIVRYRLTDDGRLADKSILVDDLPAADYHDGLPLRFGPDGKLHASTGDATQRELAQEMDSLAGKYLRVNPDGTIPDDNPWPTSPIFSLGHRNSQGFDFHPQTDLMYATEHGPSLGVEPWSGGDELNLVRKGGNYGWPIYHNEKTGADEPGFTAPLELWDDAIAPAGASFYTGDKLPAWKNRFVFAGLRGEALWLAKFGGADNPDQVESLERVLHKQYGRLRAVEQGPDGYLYFTTSNRDKRGTPAANDDRVLRIVPAD
jgi:glucose/arabinose dehydrogenase